MYAMIAIKIRSVKGNRLLVVIIWAKIAIPQLLKKKKKSNDMNKCSPIQIHYQNYEMDWVYGKLF